MTAPAPGPRPKLLLICDERVRNNYLPPAEIERLESFADWDWVQMEGGGIYETNTDPEDRARLMERIQDAEGFILCHGGPRIDAEIMAHAPNLRILGELEGDRFASRIDLEAAWARKIRTIDTTNGSSYPVAEWALAMILMALRNAGARFREIITGRSDEAAKNRRDMAGMLTGRRVGLIGCGHIGRRLIDYLRPFNTDVWVHDPYLPPEIADLVGCLQTSMDNVFSECDVVVCLAPLTPKTRGMIGQHELELLRPGTAFVNVSRGAIVDSDALVERLKKGDITAALDVFDPEPIPADNEIIGLPSVFLSPHFAAITGDQYPHFFGLMVDELERFFAGHETRFDLTPRSQANREGLDPEGK